MDKRLLNFMLVSMLLFIGYMELLKLTRPPEPAADEGIVADQVDEPVAPAQIADKPSDDVQLAEGDPEPRQPREPQAFERPAGVQRFTIGSVEPESGYPMLVTFNSKGGAVERVELSNPRYQDLNDKAAYIGHLALEATGPGVKVNVVGDGTPASQAGIRVGDVITNIGEVPVKTLEAARLALAAHKFGTQIPIQLLRDGTAMTVTVASAPRPMEVIRPEPKPDEPLQLQQLSYLLTLYQLGHKRADYGEEEIAGLPSLRNENWLSEVVQQDGVTKLEFRFPLTPSMLQQVGLEGSLEIVKRFWLTPVSGDLKEGRQHHFNFELEFINHGEQNLEVGYRMDGPTGLPLEGWWYSYKTHPTKWSGAGVRDVVWRAAGENHQFHTNPMVTKRLNKNPESPHLVIVDNAAPKKLQYLGVDAQYFNSTLLAADEPDAAGVVFDRVDARALSGVDEKRASRTPITFRADSVVIRVPSQQTSKFNFEVFAGPKHPEVLDDYGLGECIVYGWFKMPALLMAWLLHAFYAIVRNYGLAIILLTLLVRACMFPIGRQQAMNAKKMQELTPEIKKIKEKYPKDTEKQAKAQQELFRKHNYNPVAGCLPMFLQLPIFIGLYRALSVDIELRQTPFIPGLEWCSNLAAPDMLLRWDSLIPFEFLTGYTGYLGPYLNLLPLVSTGLFLVHQQLFTPPPTDEQQEMQQKVMKFMMLFMLVIFFKVPSGLCIYFITSSLWALAERMLLPKDKKKDGEQTPVSLSEKKQPAVAGVSAGGSGASSSVAAKKKRRKRNRK